MAVADEIENTNCFWTSFEKFSDDYQRIGGTSKVAENIFNILDVNSDSILTVQEIQDKIGQVLTMFGRINVFGSGAVMDGVEFDFDTGHSDDIKQNSIPNDIEGFQRDEL